MAKDKKEVKEAVEKVVEEIKAEDIPVKVVKEKTPKGKKIMIIHESGQMGYIDDDNNFVPA
jgi:hypothetical protein